jgi:hypothetical protein
VEGHPISCSAFIECRYCSSLQLVNAWVCGPHTGRTAAARGCFQYVVQPLSSAPLYVEQIGGMRRCKFRRDRQNEVGTCHEAQIARNGFNLIARVLGSVSDRVRVTANLQISTSGPVYLVPTTGCSQRAADRGPELLFVAFPYASESTYHVPVAKSIRSIGHSECFRSIFSLIPNN